MGVPTALLYSLIGIVLVFAVLVVLMYIVKILGIICDKFNWKKPAFGKTEAQSPAVAPTGDPAEGSCGDITLVRTEERDAALIMAIVADETGKPLNELRFKSIKRVDEGD